MRGFELNLHADRRMAKEPQAIIICAWMYHLELLALQMRVRLPQGFNYYVNVPH